MKKIFFKRLLLFVLLPLVLLAGVIWILGWLALKRLTDNLVKWIEASRNCRAHIETCTVSLWSSPARLDLTGVTLVPRDAEADNATPLEGRPRIVRKTTYCSVGTATLEADLVDLILHQRLTVRRLTIDGANVKFEVRPGADNSLKEIFRSPAIVAGKPAGSASAPKAAADPATSRKRDTKPTAAAPGETDEPDDSPPPPPFNARELKLPATLQQVNLTNGQIRIRNKKTKSTYRVTNVGLNFTDIAVDPSHLDTANRATVALQGKLIVDNTAIENEPYAELALDLRGQLTPFDATTGDLAPVMSADATLLKGSMVQNLPALQKLQKNLDLAEQAGLKLKPLAARAQLQHDTILRLALADNHVRFAENAALDFTDYQLAMQKDSFIDLTDDSHEFGATVRASDALSTQALKGADEFLAGLGGNSAKELQKLFIAPLVKDGRITMNFTSTGRLDKPKVKVDNPLAGFKNEFKEKGADLLDSLQDAITPKAKEGKKKSGKSRKTDDEPAAGDESETTK